jgi:hypothetical protein
LAVTDDINTIKQEVHDMMSLEAFKRSLLEDEIKREKAALTQLEIISRNVQEIKAIAEAQQKKGSGNGTRLLPYVAILISLATSGILLQEFDSYQRVMLGFKSSDSPSTTTANGAPTVSSTSKDTVVTPPTVASASTSSS